jgi:phage tail protein X
MLNRVSTPLVAKHPYKTSVDHLTMKNPPQWRHVISFTAAVFAAGFALGEWNPPAPASAAIVTPAAASKAPAP